MGSLTLIALEKTLKACVKHAPQSYIPQRVRELGVYISTLIGPQLESSSRRVLIPWLFQPSMKGSLPWHQRTFCCIISRCPSSVYVMLVTQYFGTSQQSTWELPNLKYYTGFSYTPNLLTFSVVTVTLSYVISERYIFKLYLFYKIKQSSNKFFCVYFLTFLFCINFWFTEKLQWQ